MANPFDKISDPTKIPGSAVFDVSKLSDDELNYFINSQKNSLARDAESQQSSPAYLGMKRRLTEVLGNLETESARRGAAASAEKGKTDIMSLFSGGGGGAGVQGSEPSDGSREREAFDEIYANASDSGKRAIDEIYANERKRAINEAGATGNLRSPGFQTQVLGDIDTRKVRSLTDLIQGLEGERARGVVDLESNLADRGFRERGLNLDRQKSLASLIQGGGQFSEGLGFEREKFGEERRRNTLSDLLERESLDEARFLGRAQANAMKPTGIDQFAKIAGGAGALLGGIGALRRPKIATAGVN